MTSNEPKHTNRALLAAIAGTLVLGISACSKTSDQDRVGQVTPPPGATRDRTADATPSSPVSPNTAIAPSDSGKAAEDATLTDKVKSALTSEPDLKAQSINVDTTAGVVTLKGTIDSRAKSQKAEQIASNVAGVRSVRNELVIVSG